MVDPSAETERDFSPLPVEAFFAANHGDEGESYAFHLGALWPTADDSDWSWNPQLLIGATQNTAEQVSAIKGFDLMLRWTPGVGDDEPADGLAWFLEIGAGIQYVGPESFPQFGTHLNGRLRGGFGGRFDLDDTSELLLGVNWLHMSNGNALQPNVGHDGPMLYLGLRRTF